MFGLLRLRKSLSTWARKVIKEYDKLRAELVYFIDRGIRHGQLVCGLQGTTNSTNNRGAMGRQVSSFPLAVASSRQIALRWIARRVHGLLPESDWFSLRQRHGNNVIHAGEQSADLFLLRILGEHAPKPGSSCRAICPKREDSHSTLSYVFASSCVNFIAKS